MILYECFIKYLKRGIEQEVVKNKKSLEIYRRIDIFFSIFRKYGLVYDEMKSFWEFGYKVEGKYKDDFVDFCFDIECCKKYKERDFK